MVLGKRPVPGRPTILNTVGQGPIALAVGVGGGGLDIFTLIYPFSSFSLSLSQRAVKPKTTNQLKRGDLVRITHMKHPFRRSYQQQYTSEVFKTSNRQNKNGIPMYSLKDLNNQNISSALLYSSELQKVEKDENSLWFIDKILKKRRRNGKLQYFVSWEGFPKSFNSWIPSEEVKKV